MKKIIHVVCAMLAVVMLISAAAEGTVTLESMLSNVVADVQPGAAGCSLRAVKCAADLMKWGMTAETDTAEIEAAVAAAKTTEGFEEAMNLLYGAYCDLLTDEAGEILDSAGCDPTQYDFSEIESIDVVEEIIAAAGISG